MIATKNSFETTRAAQATPLSGDAIGSAESSVHSSDQLPKSARIYVSGTLHEDIRVPMREITLSPTWSFNDRIEVNESVRVYDTSGPWGDPEFKGSVENGLPALRAKWIRDRGDVEEYDGRLPKPIDDGYLTERQRGIHSGGRGVELQYSGLSFRQKLLLKNSRVADQCRRQSVLTAEVRR